MPDNRLTTLLLGYNQLPGFPQFTDGGARHVTTTVSGFLEPKGLQEL